MGQFGDNYEECCPEYLHNLVLRFEIYFTDGTFRSSVAGLRRINEGRLLGVTATCVSREL